MMAIALVGLPFSGRQIVAESLTQKGFVPFPLEKLREHFETVDQMMRTNGGNLVITDVNTEEDVTLVRSLFGALVVGVRASTSTRLERAQKKGFLEQDSDFKALDQLDTKMGFDHTTLKGIDDHLDAMVLTDVSESALSKNLERITAPPEVKAEMFARGPERG